MIHSPADGIIRGVHKIADIVERGETIAVIRGEDGDVEVPASLDGILRGLIVDGYKVNKGLKIADIDPREAELSNCFTISDKARCIGGSVLEIAVAVEHGTNPASSTMAGFKVISIPSNEDGCVDLDKLRSVVGEDTAGLMLTNPNTVGIFDKNILEITKIVHGNALGIDVNRIEWKRAVDMNDRQLRSIVDGLGPKGNGVPREDGFNITVASEVMAVFCLASSITDLKQRLAKIVIAYNFNNEPVTVGDIKAQGAAAALLKDAFKPNMVQTLEGNPVFIHGGPFANIAHASRGRLYLADRRKSASS